MIARAAAYPPRSKVMVLAMPPDPASLPAPRPAPSLASTEAQDLASLGAPYKSLPPPPSDAPTPAGRAPGAVWGMPDMVAGPADGPLAMLADAVTDAGCRAIRTSRRPRRPWPSGRRAWSGACPTWLQRQPSRRPRSPRSTPHRASPRWSGDLRSLRRQHRSRRPGWSGAHPRGHPRQRPKSRRSTLHRVRRPSARRGLGHA